MTERIASIDALRGIGIFLVVLGHVYSSDSFAIVYIYSFHIPLFFFVSGYLFTRSRFTGYAGFFKNKLQTRIVPYVFFFLISYLIHVIFVLRSVSRETGMSVFTVIAMDNFKPILLDMVNLLRANGESLAINVPLWFLPCLFVAELYFYSVCRLTSSNMKLLFVLILVSGAAYFESIYFNKKLPWSLNTALVAMVFYGLGYLWKEFAQQKRYSAFGNRKYALYLFGLSTILCISLSRFNGRVDMNEGVYGNIFYFYGGALSGIYSYLLISPWLSKRPIVTYLGKNSLIILGVHIHLYLPARLFLNKFAHLFFSDPVVVQNDLYVFLISVVMLIFSVPIIYFITMLVPFLVGKRRDFSRVRQVSA